MSTKSISATIKGISPLLMHAFPLEQLEAPEKKTKEEQAKYAAYICPESGRLYVPGINIQRGLVAAASFSKGKGRSSLQKQTAACVFINPERVYLGQEHYEIDSRPVVIAATKGRIIRHRPRFDKWQLSFTIDYDDTLLKESEIRKIVDDLGQRVGLLDFRPEKKGPFGRFVVTEWKDASPCPEA